MKNEVDLKPPSGPLALGVTLLSVLQAPAIRNQTRWYVRSVLCTSLAFWLGDWVFLVKRVFFSPAEKASRSLCSTGELCCGGSYQQKSCSQLFAIIVAVRGPGNWKISDKLTT